MVAIHISHENKSEEWPFSAAKKRNNALCSYGMQLWDVAIEESYMQRDNLAF